MPGLSIRVGADRWIDAPSRPKSFLVNSGTHLRRWTNDRFLSTEHRVLNTSGVERVGMPFFYLPDPGTEVAPLPTCVDEANPPHYEPIVSDPTRYEDEPLESFPEVTRHHPGVMGDLTDPDPEVPERSRLSLRTGLPQPFSTPSAVCVHITGALPEVSWKRSPVV